MWNSDGITLKWCKNMKTSDEIKFYIGLFYVNST